MTMPFDPALQIWKIRVQFGDVVSFVDEEHPDKRLVGTVYDIRTSGSTAGVMATYRIGDEEDREYWIDNFHDPKLVDAALLAEYNARRRAVVVRKDAEWAEKLKGYCCASRAVGYEANCRCSEPRGYVPPRLSLQERCAAAIADPESSHFDKLDKWQLVCEVDRLVKANA